MLYVDDEPNNLIVFRNAFFRHFRVITSSAPADALHTLKSEEVHVIISDQRMPDMTGIDFLSAAKEISPDSIKMILTAYSDMDVILKAVNEVGIYQFILKPWDTSHLLLTINNALQKYELSAQNKLLIADLEQAKAHLEQKVSERTIELATKNKELSTLNEVKNKFFSIISHDLKLPIASLNILLEIMLSFKHQLDEQKVHDLGEKAKEYLQHVTQLLDNLLHWSLSQTGEIKINNKKTDLVKVAKGQVDLFEFLASQKGIKMALHSADGPIWSMVDENMVSLVLRNLISNAIKYSHEKGEIHVSFASERDWVTVAISDNGVGIPGEIIAKLQQNAWNEPRRGTMNEKGAGLGLRLGQEFVAMLNGQLLIDSKESGGTIVRVLLPLLESQNQNQFA